MEGTNHIPKIMIIGLISAYDYLLSRLLSVVFQYEIGGCIHIREESLI